MIIRGWAQIALISLLLLLATPMLAVEIPFDVSTWNVIQYEFNDQPDATWEFPFGSTVARQTTNADASILLSNLDIAGQEVEGDFSVATASDDDFIGFVFGYQDRGSYYLFDWKQGSQFATGFGQANAGMSVKRVSTGGADPTGPELWDSNGGANVSVLANNNIGWQDNTAYRWRLNFNPGFFELEILQGTTSLQLWQIADSTYTNGRFGFYNYSQDFATYAGFTRETDPDPVVPEPSTMILLGLGMVGMGVHRRRKRT